MTGQDLVGQRIKTIRRQRGLSQAQLAHPELSDSYVSLIESGKRTPTPAVLELLAQKLDCSLTYLVNGVTAEQMEEIEVGLRFARLALENGEAQEARRRYAELLTDTSLTGLAQLRQEAEYGCALATEACGDRREAIRLLKGLRADTERPMSVEWQVAVAVALCRCYRDEGELGEAVRVGEALLGGTTRPAWTDALIELGSTLLSVYRTRGDLLRARHFASELLSAAELLGTPRAIVAASWNAAFVAQETGRGEEGMSLLERAMAIHSENGDHRNLARLRVAYATMIVRTRANDVEAARDLLLRAQREMSESSASVLDKARCQIELGRTELALGNPRQAVENTRVADEMLRDSRGEHWADANLVQGQALLILHEDEEAAVALNHATEAFDPAPMRRWAQSWLTVAEAYDRLHDHDQSIIAAQKALACVGL
nr:helix-turn-helix domain-containing protein [Herbidospora sakaeratensis]